MFTGIITTIGTVKSLEKRGGDVSLVLSAAYEMETVALGASIACDGVCLTVVEKGNDWFAVDVSAETLSCTTLGSWKEGAKVNLERALKLGDELGGHLVSGHVDGLAKVVSIRSADKCYIVTLSIPNELKCFVAAKGSVTLGGVSLTVNQVEDRQFSVNIIPHTWQQTNFHLLQTGAVLNLEIDILARYMKRMLECGVRSSEFGAV